MEHEVTIAIHFMTIVLCTYLEYHNPILFCSTTVPSPTVTVSSPGGMYFATTELTLTCTVEIASALGSVAVTTMWMGPQGMLPGTNATTGGNTLRYESMLTIDSLPTTSSATYTCTAMVDGMPSNEFITASIETDSLEISIGRQILSHIVYGILSKMIVLTQF